jgi:heme exporter protein A
MTLASPHSEILLSASQLCRRFGRRWAFSRIDLQVHEGERILIFGANGSGKTTLLRSLATLLRPSQGQLQIFGLDAQHQAESIRGRLALLSHHHGLYEDLSARDNLGVLASLCGKNAAVTELLAEVGLEDRPDAVRNFSAGMRKRLQLAMVRVQQPELILLDEPFSALDPSAMDRVGELIGRLDGTVLLASHQVERAAALCDRAILLDEGQLRWQGPADRAWEAWQQLQHEGKSP